jgi:hypothetical protein
MRARHLTRPTTDLFAEHKTLDAYQLNRVGAFNGPMAFPLRKLRTDRDYIEQHFLVRPPQVIAVERARAGIHAARPWFLCYRCHRRCARLYVNSIDILCRQCSDLQWLSNVNGERHGCALKPIKSAAA